jgi:cell division topological specificity factor
MLRFFFNRRERETAPVASERLKVLLAHERTAIGKSDLLGVLRKEILDVIGKHVNIDPDKVRVKADSDAKASTLTVDIEIPIGSVPAAPA